MPDLFENICNIFSQNSVETTAWVIPRVAAKWGMLRNELGLTNDERQVGYLLMEELGILTNDFKFTEKCESRIVQPKGELTIVELDYKADEIVNLLLEADFDTSLKHFSQACYWWLICCDFSEYTEENMFDEVRLKICQDWAVQLAVA